jgi:hypothetical protein
MGSGTYSQFVGYDFHPGSIDAARTHAREHNVSNAKMRIPREVCGGSGFLDSRVS